MAFTHDGWGNLANLAQDHDSAVDGNAFHVAFAYAKAAPSGGRQTIRRSSMTFPSGYAAQYVVLNSTIESNLSRVGQVRLGHANNFVTVATYDYLGTSGVVGTTLPEPGVYSNRFDSGGDYVQLDRWNRPTTWTWTKDLATDPHIDFYDVDIVYNKRGDILRTIDNVMADTSGTHYFDRAYTLDALGRVLGETRGNWVASAISTTREERNWALTAMGNWASRDIDLDGAGIDFAEDNLDPDLATHFSNANQWSRRNVTTGGSPVSLDYDDNGNLINDGEQYAYIYDAWNRLVGVDSLSTDSPLTRYRYNGLGQRIVESDGITNTSLIYDERWRLISRSEAGKYTEETLYHHAGLDGMGGASDIDGVILRRTFLATGTPQTEDKRWYVLQNWRQDPVVIISDAGVQRERAFFSPYGRVFGMPAGDLNFDGEFTSDEATTISGWSAAYRAYADINLDGVIDGDDATANTPGALGWDALSRDGSTIGYAGYVQDSYIPTLSHVRHRVYKSDLGRWVQRDPAGYVDGANLYEYVRSSPIVRTASFGPVGVATNGPSGGGGGGLGLSPSTCLAIYNLMISACGNEYVGCLAGCLALSTTGVGACCLGCLVSPLTSAPCCLICGGISLVGLAFCSEDCRRTYVACQQRAQAWLLQCDPSIIIAYD